jgi:hypothetical protein
MGNSDSRTDPMEFRFLISTSYYPDAHRQGSPVFILIWLSLRVAPVTPGAHLSVMVEVNIITKTKNQGLRITPAPDVVDYGFLALTDRYYIEQLF